MYFVQSYLPQYTLYIYMLCDIQEALNSALEIKPKDFLANYRFAIALGKEGSGDNAVGHYQRCLYDEKGVSDQLKKFINDQIKRVKTKGPMIKPATLGLRFSSW